MAWALQTVSPWLWDFRAPHAVLLWPDDPVGPELGGFRAWRVRPSSSSLPAGASELLAGLALSRGELPPLSGPLHALVGAVDPEHYWLLRGRLSASTGDAQAPALRRHDAYWLRDDLRAALAAYMPPGWVIAVRGRQLEFRDSMHWHWAWLHAETATGAVNDLQQGSPALANLLARACATWPPDEYRLRLGCRLAGPQTELLRALGWPAEPWVARLLRRLRGALCTGESLEFIRFLLDQPQLTAALRELPRWASPDVATEALELMIHHGVSPLLLWRTLRGDDATRPQRLRNFEGQLQRYREMADALELVGATTAIHSQRQLRRTLRTLTQSALQLPPAPLMPARRGPRVRLRSTTDFRRLNSVAGVVAAGERLGNCLASYIPLLRDDSAEQLWLLDGESPLALHVRFASKRRRWLLIQASGCGQRPATPQESERLARWLAEPCSGT